MTRQINPQSGQPSKPGKAHARPSRSGRFILATDEPDASGKRYLKVPINEI